MQGFLRLLGSALAASMLVIATVTAFAFLCGTPVKAGTIKLTALPVVCDTASELKEVARVRNQLALERVVPELAWVRAVNAANKAPALPVCRLLSFRFFLERPTAVVAIGDQAYAIYQVFVTGEWSEGAWWPLHEVKYALLPIRGGWRI